MSEAVLYITDSRTSKKYEIPINCNTVRAAAFQAIKAPDHKTDPAHQVGSGLRLYDLGFKNTAISESKITFLDGARGLVQFRGYNIADFWNTAQFENLMHLLVWGHWPSAEEKETLRSDIVNAARDISESVIRVIQAFPCIWSSLAWLHISVHGQKAHAGRNIYHNYMSEVDKAIIRTVASFQLCVGLAGAHQAGVPFTPVDVNGSFLYNTLLMMGKVDISTGKPDPRTVSCLRRTWALGADLGFTNSTAAFLHGASTLGDLISCLISALSSGYGILHFGAAEASLRSLAAIGRKENVLYVIAKVRRREAKLFGYGHRISKTRDPRIIFGMQIMHEIDSKHPLLEVANEIDRIARSDEYFVSRKLEANGDLFLGIAYTALNFDPSTVPVLMGLMRVGGMMAHWREAMTQPISIWRPQQFYTGEVKVHSVKKDSDENGIMEEAADDEDSYYVDSESELRRGKDAPIEQKDGAFDDWKTDCIKNFGNKSKLHN